MIASIRINQWFHAWGILAFIQHPTSSNIQHHFPRGTDRNCEEEIILTGRIDGKLDWSTRDSRDSKTARIKGLSYHQIYIYISYSILWIRYFYIFLSLWRSLILSVTFCRRQSLPSGCRKLQPCRIPAASDRCRYASCVALVRSCAIGPENSGCWINMKIQAGSFDVWPTWYTYIYNWYKNWHNLILTPQTPMTNT